MVLPDDVIEIFRLAHLDVRTRVGANALNGRRVGATLVDGYLLGHTVQPDCSLQELPGSGVVSLGPQEKVDGVAVAVNRPVQILPLAGDLDVGRRSRPSANSCQLGFYAVGTRPPALAAS